MAEDERWPSRFGAWPASPWVITGRQATAWFTVPDAVVARYLHPDLRPPPAPQGHQSRLRFYAMEAHGERFHEAVVSLPARAGDVDGEVTVILWSDSEAYRTWAREAFGWPVLEAGFHYAGALWDDELAIGATGSSRARVREGELALRVDEPLAPAAPAAAWMVRRPWLTMRRIVHRGGLGGETREVLHVRPELRRPGTRLAAQGAARFDLAPGDPLTALGEIRCEIEVLDGFELVVGDDVELVRSERCLAR
jgi:hypothetical protein